MDGRLIKGSLALVLAVVAALGPWCRPAMAQLSPEEAMRLLREKEGRVSTDASGVIAEHNPKLLARELERLNAAIARKSPSTAMSSSGLFIVPRARADWSGKTFLVLGEYDLNADVKASAAERDHLIRLLQLGGGRVVEAYSKDVDVVAISDSRADGLSYGYSKQVNLKEKFKDTVTGSFPSMSQCKRVVESSGGRWLDHGDVLRFLGIGSEGTPAQREAFRRVSKYVSIPTRSTPLKDHFAYLARRSEANFYIDWVALEVAGVKPDTSIASLDTGGKVYSLLNALLRHAGRLKLKAGIDPWGVIVVSSRSGIADLTAQAAITADDYRSDDAKRAARRMGLAVSLMADKLPMEQALAKVEDEALVDFKIDWAALGRASVRQSTPVGLTLKDVPAERVLGLMLHQAGGSGLRFAVQESNGEVIIPASGQVVGRQKGPDAVVERPRTTPPVGTTKPVGKTSTTAAAAGDMTSQMTFTNRRLTVRQALQVWSNAIGLEVDIDWNRIEEAGIYRRSQIRVEVDGGSAEQVLKAILDASSRGDAVLKFKHDAAANKVVITLGA